ncbi:hypothetical protein [Streptomyces sp. NPDC014006]|uniref:hypothetical protein n=1 Tax=Streptomyces sp. NPDC014006 TaxID=3364870 RepID=UPI0036FAE31C
MWPGDQSSPGGQDNRYGQPNPYQQPGYHQPNPYTQSSGDLWNAPTITAPPPPGGSGRRTKVIAVTVAATVVVAAAVTGAVLLGGGSDHKAAPDPIASSASASPSSDADPRNGDGAPKPTIAGWKVVVNTERGIAFDVPAGWTLKSPGWVSYVSDKNDPKDKPIVGMKAPALLNEKWCGEDTDRDGRIDYTQLASVGSRGNNGARSTEEIARSDSASWVYGAYSQPDRKKITTSAVTTFTTASGITGSLATSQSSGVVRRHKCDTDGKATTFAFKDAEGDFVSWSFVGAKGVGEEVPDTTVRQILNTVRLVKPTES